MLKLNLRALRIAPSSTFIAVNTGDGSELPLAHAEPVEQERLFMSNAIIVSWRSVPRKETLLVWGNRSTLCP